MCNSNVGESRKSKFASVQRRSGPRTSDSRYNTGDLSGVECSSIADSDQQKPWKNQSLYTESADYASKIISRAFSVNCRK